MSRIGFVGTGHITAPKVRCLAAKGHAIAVTRRNEAVSSSPSESHGVTVAEPQDVIDASEILFLCLRPQHAESSLKPLVFRADHRIVSVMAAVAHAAVARLCSPATDMVRTIPLVFLEHGDRPLAAYGNVSLLADLFAPENPVVKVATEPALNAHFSICTLAPGMLELMATGADWLAAETGDADRAEFYTTQLMSGFLAALSGGAGQLAAERAALATEGTISLQMIRALRDGDAPKALRRALTEINERLQQS